MTALPASDGVILRAVRNLGLVDLDQFGEQHPVGSHHRATQLVQHQPRGFIAAKPELRLS